MSIISTVSSSRSQVHQSIREHKSLESVRRLSSGVNPNNGDGGNISFSAGLASRTNTERVARDNLNNAIALTQYQMNSFQTVDAIVSRMALWKLSMDLVRKPVLGPETFTTSEGLQYQMQTKGFNSLSRLSLTDSVSAADALEMTMREQDNLRYLMG
ncbi:MAG: hypothetical protein HOB63_11600 [Opitutae bacterium]|nr:hypothetical protein [Opitutae bacterium]MBT6852439.1 hypothetical protein [Opitutae bacterium]MBT7743429.1 hypothetical protein [Opitutae bacterium]MBT7922948.1 hypothetical protein [Opitutae bacterium]